MYLALHQLLVEELEASPLVLHRAVLWTPAMALAFSSSFARDAQEIERAHGGDGPGKWSKSKLCSEADIPKVDFASGEGLCKL